MNQNLGNLTTISYFTLKGISDRPDLQAPIFWMVLFLYIAVLSENMIISLLIAWDHRLHTPMYFFLFNLSALDILYTTITLHKILGIYISGINRISFNDCIAQMYFYISAVCNEFLILTAMSFDRYVAICNPLHYSVIMSKRVYASLAGVCWVLSAIEAIPQTYLISGHFCFKSNEINHFLCDVMALMKLSCGGSNVLDRLILIESVFVEIIPLSLTLTSYIYIIKAILRIRSTKGRRKAFYTCSSHLTVVVIFYVTVFCLYTKPTSALSADSDKLFSLLYIAVTPMLNPLIYCLKNEKFKLAWNCILSKIRNQICGY
ncbi:olfactory receptor 8U3-like [Pseudophryne corroboree]|uniref:olfactory receptor 8U3-like n=1 Tax=Pseudophryne corroboree TaxID=495146 RepID=UPI003081CE94